MHSHQSGKYSSIAAARASFAKIKINLNYIDLDRKCRCIMVTSALPGEGKSFVSANLAAAYESEGMRILLIDADMSHPSLQKVFTLENQSGLSACIAENLDYTTSLNKIGEKNLYVLPSGRMPPSPTTLLSSQRMETLLRDAREKFDKIVIDTPPVLATSDAVALSQHVDGVLFVARWGKTAKQDITKAVHQLKLAGAPLIGSVLNNLRSEKGYY